MIKRFLITIEYDGANYSGWQRQKNGLAVQQVLEEGLEAVLGEPITVFGSSRTDAGVCASAQTAHFDSRTRIAPERIPFAVNGVLPKDISVKKCVETAPDFHARFSNKIKTYVYRLYVSEVRRPLYDAYAFWQKKPLDIAAMRRAAGVMEGTYDCKCFQRAGSPSGDTVKTIYSVTVGELSDGRLDITVSGGGFLYKMVRTMAGTLLYAGLGKLSKEDILQAIKSGDAAKTGKTLPPEFLCLTGTEYI
ncbi:MAG: tRNA pseudouridine(38-40) synthase TruA [Clostridiales bacterium]|jgi:tRNA pseudouridine38-40 synthase|nr:tRNA pseudouridine(38-40) synthase TruA [Clostridiales bacterium]